MTPVHWFNVNFIISVSQCVVAGSWKVSVSCYTDDGRVKREGNRTINNPSTVVHLGPEVQVVTTSFFRLPYTQW